MSRDKVETIHQQWQTVTYIINEQLKALTDEELGRELAPGKNHGLWLLGHLITSEDFYNKYLRGEKLCFPEYEKLCGMGATLLPPGDFPKPAAMREHWQQVLDRNEKLLSELTDEDWDQPHCQPGGGEEGDFFKTKGGFITFMSSHEMYHSGQLGILVSLAGKSKI